MQMLATTHDSCAVVVRDIELRAADGRMLAATLFSPGPRPRGTVIIHGATAVPQGYYRRFAYFVAQATGARVLSYDYRGIGRSRPARLRGYAATMSEWALLDAAAAHDFARECHAGEPVALVGHSFGGQLLGLLEQAREARGAVLVGAQSGYLGHWPRRTRLRLWLLWRVIVPLLTRTLGYLPARAGLREDLPGGVAEQWARWCTHPDYLISDHPEARERFARFDRPILFYSVADDKFAPSLAVTSLCERLAAARLERAHIDPAEYGGEPIGHFGFFRSRFAPDLWQETAAFLRDAIDGNAPRRRRIRHAAAPSGVVLADTR